MENKRNSRGQFLKGTHWREHKPFREKEWLIEQYQKLERSAGDIARQFGTSDPAILFWLRKHNIKRRTTSESRSVKHWGVSGVDNPMWNRKGDFNPNWKGGVTPERQEFYASQEWKTACSAVWNRDNATCRRCGMRKPELPDIPFHIHHIVSFADIKLRADIGNLVLLCKTCHNFVHSRRNLNREHLPKEPNS